MGWKKRSWWENRRKGTCRSRHTERAAAHSCRLSETLPQTINKPLKQNSTLVWCGQNYYSRYTRICAKHMFIWLKCMWKRRKKCGWEDGGEMAWGGSGQHNRRQWRRCFTWRQLHCNILWLRCLQTALHPSLYRTERRDQYHGHHIHIYSVIISLQFGVLTLAELYTQIKDQIRTKNK